LIEPGSLSGYSLLNELCSIQVLLSVLFIYSLIPIE
jgi:hypothetical protein